MEQLLLDLFQAYYDARKHKRNTINQLRFEIDYEHYLFELYDDLINGRYQIRKSIVFIVDNPVKREIFAADFRDRIIHHLIYNYINPVIDEQLIDCCYSCRKGKGTHFAVRQMYQFMQECSGNYTHDCFVLKLDIRGYFMNIDKTVLWKKVQAMLGRACKGNTMIHHLIKQVIFNDPKENCIIKGKRSDWLGLPASKSLFSQREDCGLPIGNLTSQLFSNVYLNEFDQFVKTELGAEYYGRYVDDFVLIHRNKEFLMRARDKIKAYLWEHCRLELHPNKVYLQHYRKGFTFLGAYILPHRVYIGNRTKKKFIEMIRLTNDLLSRKIPTRKEFFAILSAVNSYLGIMKHYKTYAIRRKHLLDAKQAPMIFKYGYVKAGKGKGMIYKRGIINQRAFFV